MEPGHVGLVCHPPRSCRTGPTKPEALANVFQAARPVAKVEILINYW